jgi:two-component system response regulator PilR (NtrC family)
MPAAGVASTSIDRRLLGDSLPMRNLRKQIDKLARSQAPVYVSGESGSGKELVARLIHDQGPRANQPFVPVNCGAIPSELMESEFFGHRKGSFSGAVEDKPGLFQAAQGGTLFLDEVADLPLPMQVKLLRAIQEKAVRSVGGQQEEVVDVRILCATHKDLAAEIAAERFRQDLYYRLNVIELRVPPLRERRDDIEVLASHMLKRLASGHRPAGAQYCTLKRSMRLKSYRFPGQCAGTGEHARTGAHPVRKQTDRDASDLRLAEGNCAAESGVPDLTQIDNLEDYLENVERQLILAGAGRNPLEPHGGGSAVESYRSDRCVIG